MKLSGKMLMGLVMLSGTVMAPLSSQAAENETQECGKTIVASKNVEAPPTEIQDLITNFTEQKEQNIDQKMRAGRTVTFKRGSALMWSKDIISFNYSGGRVTSSSGRQEAGWIFPNIVRKNGITRYSTSSSTHKWRGEKTIGAGVVSPWGDVTIYNYDFTDYYGVHGNGSSSWY